MNINKIPEQEKQNNTKTKSGLKNIYFTVYLEKKKNNNNLST